MERLEFKPNTSVPMASGPNYSRFVNIRKSADLKANNNNGPFSSLFDYEKNAAELEAENEKKQSVQKKIMRTNALGEAFRLIAEGIGASAGATITPRNVNPGILSAVNEYGKNNTEYMQRLQGLKSTKLALNEADLKYNMGQEATALDKAEKQAERSHQESIQASKELDQFINENKLLEKTYRLRGMEAEAEGVRKKTQAAIEASLSVEVAREKAKFDRGWGLQGEGQPQFDLSTPSKSTAKNPKIPFIVPDLPTKTVQLPPELIDEIRFQLIGPDGNKYDPAVPEALRAVLKNKKAEQSSLMQAIRENWNEGANIKDRMKGFAPNAYEQIYGQIGNETAPQTVQAGPVKPTAVKGPDGTTDLDDASKEQIMIDSDIILESNLEDGKKLKQIESLYIERYKSIGKTVAKKDATTFAQNVMREYRQLLKAQKDSTVVK